MKISTIAKILIALGIGLMLFALTMPVSMPNSDVVNLYLMSEKQNTLMFGGVSFLGGIVLFALFKSKQSKDEEIESKIKSERLKENIKSNTSNAVLSSFDKLKSFFANKNEGYLNLIYRVTFGFIFGWFASEIFGDLIKLIFYRLGDSGAAIFSTKYGINYDLADSLVSITSFIVILIFILYSLSSQLKSIIFKNLLIISLLFFLVVRGSTYIARDFERIEWGVDLSIVLIYSFLIMISKSKKGFYHILTYSILVIISVLILLLSYGLTHNSRDTREIPISLIDNPAPDFTAPNLQDTSLSLTKQEMLGKVWLLNVWASWCVACREEYPLLVEFSKSKMIPIIGLDYKDNDQFGLEWLARYGNPYDVSIIDLDGNIGKNFSMHDIPESFLIDKTGIIRYRQTGPLTEDVIQNKLIPLIREVEK